MNDVQSSALMAVQLQIQVWEAIHIQYRNSKQLSHDAIRTERRISIRALSKDLNISYGSVATHYLTGIRLLQGILQ